MNPTTLATRSMPVRTVRRWSGAIFGVLVGMAVVCHGCHLGDHDDELSVNGRETKRIEDPGSYGSPS